MIVNGKTSTRPIRDLRLAAGLSQEQVARLADCSTAYVRVLERGYAPDPATSPVYRRVEALLNDNGVPPQDAAVKTEPVESAHHAAG